MFRKLLTFVQFGQEIPSDQRKRAVQSFPIAHTNHEKVPQSACSRRLDALLSIRSQSNGLSIEVVRTNRRYAAESSLPSHLESTCPDEFQPYSSSADA